MYVLQSNNQSFVLACFLLPKKAIVGFCPSEASLRREKARSDSIISVTTSPAYQLIPSWRKCPAQIISLSRTEHQVQSFVGRTKSKKKGGLLRGLLYLFDNIVLLPLRPFYSTPCIRPLFFDHFKYIYIFYVICYVLYNLCRYIHFSNIPTSEIFRLSKLLAEPSWCAKWHF